MEKKDYKYIEIEIIKRLREEGYVSRNGKLRYFSNIFIDYKGIPIGHPAAEVLRPIIPKNVWKWFTFEKKGERVEDYAHRLVQYALDRCGSDGFCN